MLLVFRGEGDDYFLKAVGRYGENFDIWDQKDDIYYLTDIILLINRIKINSK